MKTNQAVQTPDGPGIIVDIEVTGYNKRYGVELETKRYSYSPAYYFKHEVEPVQ